MNAPNHSRRGARSRSIAVEPLEARCALAPISGPAALASAIARFGVPGEFVPSRTPAVVRRVFVPPLLQLAYTNHEIIVLHNNQLASAPLAVRALLASGKFPGPIQM